MEYTTSDAVEFAITSKPVEFEDAIRQVLAQKQVAAYDLYRDAVAGDVLGVESEEAEAEAEPTAEEPEVKED